MLAPDHTGRISHNKADDLQQAGAEAPSNKGMTQTKPAQAMELRSLSPVFYGSLARARSATRHEERRGERQTDYCSR